MNPLILFRQVIGEFEKVLRKRLYHSFLMYIIILNTYIECSALIYAQTTGLPK